MVYDGDCSFCRRWIGRWQAISGDRLEYLPFQQAAEAYPDVPREEFENAVQLIQPDGARFAGAEAVFRGLAYVPGKVWPWWLYRRLPGFAWASEMFYRFVARHRRGFSTISNLLWGKDLSPPTYVLTRWLFLRVLGLVYLIAFLSLGVQILGLVGQNGILPAAEFLDALRQRFGAEAYWRFPTLAWLGADDTSLQAMCWGGVALSLLVVFRVAPAIVLAILWFLYLSLYRVGQTFLSFQWDLLLLEAGFLAIFFAPWKLSPRLTTEPRPPRVARWLLIWLLFRLMFLSGVVKLVDDDPIGREWHNLTALNYHFETQCLPPWTAWYAHQLPESVKKTAVAIVLFIEIAVPFLFFLPRRPRLIAFAFEVLLQLLIMVTGNYNFFNLLTIALCLTLLDDNLLRRCLSPVARRLETPLWRRPPAPRTQRLTTSLVAVPILLISSLWLVEAFVHFPNLPKSAQGILRESMRFQSVNTYGLFRQMTTRRPEIIVEGSNDRRTWLPYEFKWKPGDLERRPRFVAPHQPRLDWQMWFAALGDARSSRNRWFFLFLRRLLEGSPDVLALLDKDPFPDSPPKYVRAVLYDYHFTDFATRRKEGRWWSRRRLRLYVPPLSVSSFNKTSRGP